MYKYLIIISVPYELRYERSSHPMIGHLLAK